MFVLGTIHCRLEAHNRHHHYLLQPPARTAVAWVVALRSCWESVRDELGGSDARAHRNESVAEPELHFGADAVIGGVDAGSAERLVVWHLNSDHTSTGRREQAIRKHVVVAMVPQGGLHP